MEFCLGPEMIENKNIWFTFTTNHITTLTIPKALSNLWYNEINMLNSQFNRFISQIYNDSKYIFFNKIQYIHSSYKF